MIGIAWMGVGILLIKSNQAIRLASKALNFRQNMICLGMDWNQVILSIWLQTYSRNEETLHRPRKYSPAYVKASRWVPRDHHLYRTLLRRCIVLSELLPEGKRHSTRAQYKLSVLYAGVEDAQQSHWTKSSAECQTRNSWFCARWGLCSLMKFSRSDVR